MTVRHEVAISTVIPNIVRSPCVLPQVPYRDVRRWQRRGAKLSEQCTFNWYWQPNRKRRLRLPAGRRSRA